MKFFTFPSLNQKGFTLIEFLAVFSIIAVLSAVSIASFSSYNNTQIFQTSAAEVIGLMNLGKSRAIAQIKPAGCTNQTMQKYQVVITPPGPAYRLEAICNGVPVVVTSKNLGLGVIVAAGSTAIIPFAASTGTSTPSTVTLTGYGKTTVITVDTVGTISVN